MIKYDLSTQRCPTMTTIERLTVTMPKEMASTLKSAVEMGEYASTSEVVREALRDWSFKRQLMLDQLTVLKQDIDKGLADVATGRTREFDAQRIAERGRKLLAARST